MKTRFIYLLETVENPDDKKNRNQKRISIDKLGLQSRITKLADPTIWILRKMYKNDD